MAGTGKRNRYESPTQETGRFRRSVRTAALDFGSLRQALGGEGRHSGVYYLETKTAVHKGKPGFFAAVRKGKSYVSFHLMALYTFPEMTTSLSPALRRRMQGKSCFNFAQVDDQLFAELKRLTAARAKAFAGKMARLT
jgi:hypothetical protein